MNISGTINGQYVVDIDGCLRVTDLRSLGREDVIALHGRLAEDASVAFLLDDQVLLMSAGDRIWLDHDRVAFFRAERLPRLVRSVCREAAMDRSASSKLAA